MTKKSILLILALISILAGGSPAGTKAVGGDVVTIGDQRIHTFTEVGTSNLTVTSGGFVDDLASASVVDATGTGSIVVRGLGTLLQVR